MMKGSHFVRMGHSIAKFASTTQSNHELDGKGITFIGDRRARQEPLAVILPQKAWTWATHKVYSKAKKMATFYANERNYGKYFVGTEEAGINVPFVLFIPLIAVKILNLHNKSEMPHECYSLIKAYISSPKTSLDEEHWGLVLDWLLTASQGKEKKKRSVLVMELDEVACNDFGVQEWMADRVNETLGPRQKEPPSGPPLGPPPAVFTPRQQYPQHLLPIMGNIGTELGRALGLALKKASSTGSGLLESDTSIQPYMRDEYACIMAFCNVQQAQDIPKLWRHFVSTNAKQIEIHRRVIQSSMSEWAYNHRTKIDTIFFEQKMIEDVINLRFNPSNCVATYWSAEHGVSILVCRPRGIAKTKWIQDQEHAAEVTKGTRLLDEAIKLTKTNTRLPASTFYELRCSVGMFCAFLFTLFGSKCDYYQKLLNIKKILDTFSRKNE
jgi:hypothetical protein